MRQGHAVRRQDAPPGLAALDQTAPAGCCGLLASELAFSTWMLLSWMNRAMKHSTMKIAEAADASFHQGAFVVVVGGRPGRGGRGGAVELAAGVQNWDDGFVWQFLVATRLRHVAAGAGHRRLLDPARELVEVLRGHVRRGHAGALHLDRVVPEEATDPALVDDQLVVVDPDEVGVGVVPADGVERPGHHGRQQHHEEQGPEGDQPAAAGDPRVPGAWPAGAPGGRAGSPGRRGRIAVRCGRWRLRCRGPGPRARSRR